ncbi:uncharacterized protein [Amphiura filiformis]|uniref:uncharacterized protein n=1 Tax=Amphiura filiformis TaxID=82378 RepID=UPI003B217900
MCGICCVIKVCQLSEQESTSVSLDEIKINENLQRRGPDSCKSLNRIVYSRQGDSLEVSGLFNGTVLRQRGELTPQPLQDEEGNILLWNGEIFGGIKVDPSENDGLVLLSQLSNCTTDESVLHLLHEIRGPWSFVYWQETKKCLWFGRDVFGRRSLLWQWQQDMLRISSVASRPITANNSQGWQEVPAQGIYCMAFRRWKPNPLNSSGCEIILYPWQQSVSSSQSGLIGTGPVSMRKTGMETNHLGDLKQYEDAPTAKLSWCEGMSDTPWRICKSMLGIASPIVPLNKTVPGQKGCVPWQPSTVEDRDEVQNTQIELPLIAHKHISTSDEGSKGNVGSDQVKEEDKPIAGAMSDSKDHDLLSALESKLHQYAHSLLDTLEKAVCQRVHNLTRNVSTQQHDGDDGRTKHNITCSNPGKLPIANPSNADANRGMLPIANPSKADVDETKIDGI